MSSGIPGMAVSARLPAFEIRRLLRRFPFQGLLTTKKLWREIGEETLRPLAEWPFPLAGSDILFVSFAVAKPEPVDFSWLLLTSGSTGSPKAVMLAEKNLEERARGEVRLFGLTGEDRLLGVLSLTHDLGLNQLLCTLLLGARLDIRPRLMLGDFFTTLNEGSYTSVTGTPSLWALLLRHLTQTTPRSTFKGLLTVSGGSLAPMSCHGCGKSSRPPDGSRRTVKRKPSARSPPRRSSLSLRTHVGWLCPGSPRAWSTNGWHPARRVALGKWCTLVKGQCRGTGVILN